jgi:hypothetical protein
MMPGETTMMPVGTTSIASDYGETTMLPGGTTSMPSEKGGKGRVKTKTKVKVDTTSVPSDYGVTTMIPGGTTMMPGGTTSMPSDYGVTTMMPGETTVMPSDYAEGEYGEDTCMVVVGTCLEADNWPMLGIGYCGGDDGMDGYISELKPTTSLDKCKEKCQESPTCKFISYQEKFHQSCTLYSRCSPQKLSTSMWDGFQTYQNQAGCFVQADYNNGDITWHHYHKKVLDSVASASDCQTKCQATSDCGIFVYDPVDKKCWLKCAVGGVDCKASSNGATEGPLPTTRYIGGSHLHTGVYDPVGKTCSLPHGMGETTRSNKQPLSAEEQAAAPCMTSDGIKCVFPFTWQGATYNSCTKGDSPGTHWCVTQIDPDENYGPGTGNNGNCVMTNPSCAAGAAGTSGAPKGLEAMKPMQLEGALAAMPPQDIAKAEVAMKEHSMSATKLAAELEMMSPEKLKEKLEAALPELQKADAELREKKANSAFDCDADDSTVEGLEDMYRWSHDKKYWCCRIQKKGCAMPPQSTYDCDAGYQNWEAGWSRAKKSWCCQQQDRGCPSLEAAKPFDCMAGYSNWEAGWSGKKKEWCCKHEKRGCHGQCTEYMHDVGCGWTAEYACPDQTRSSLFKWPAHDDGKNSFDESKGWTCCCKQELWRSAAVCSSLACPHGYQNKDDAQYIPCQFSKCTDADKDHCCFKLPKYEESFTPDKPTSDIYNCDDEVKSAFTKKKWSNAHKGWCCRNYDKGCDCDCLDGSIGKFGLGDICTKGGVQCTVELHAPAPTPPPTAPAQAPANQSERFDCLAGFMNWEAGWSDAKKEWCCDHHQKGCQKNVPAQAFDCAAGFSNWQAGWSGAKKAWCCKFYSRGCSLTGAAEPFDCDAGFDDWVAGWSDSKQEWCCKHHDRGCGATPKREPYDCNAALVDWEEKWEDAKKNGAADSLLFSAGQKTPVRSSSTVTQATSTGRRDGRTQRKTGVVRP